MGSWGGELLASSAGYRRRNTYQENASGRGGIVSEWRIVQLSGALRMVSRNEEVTMF